MAQAAEPSTGTLVPGTNRSASAVGGEVLRGFVLDTTRTYQPTGKTHHG
jgi:hypothetical protein